VFFRIICGELASVEWCYRPVWRVLVSVERWSRMIFVVFVSVKLCYAICVRILWFDRMICIWYVCERTMVCFRTIFGVLASVEWCYRPVCGVLVSVEYGYRMIWVVLVSVHMYVE
jgi:hypothetical protein